MRKGLAHTFKVSADRASIQTCQREAWKHHHKLECKVFDILRPRVLPITVRIIVQILLRRRSGLWSDKDWTELLKLRHNIESFRQMSGITGTLEQIQLMARAAKEYTRSLEDLGFIETLFARVNIFPRLLAF